MSATKSASGPDDRDAGSWTSENLPMVVRKELLERELTKLGFRKGQAEHAAAGDSAGAQESQSSEHPQTESGGEHAE